MYVSGVARSSSPHVRDTVRPCVQSLSDPLLLPLRFLFFFFFFSFFSWCRLGLGLGFRVRVGVGVGVRLEAQE